MILEAKCSACSKHIGYLSIAGIGGPEDTCVKTIRLEYNASVAFLCDACRAGMIDLEEEGK